MSFRKEKEMYSIIRNFLESKFGCLAVENKIRFNLLKNWTIDVAGIVRKGENPEIITVEAKPNIGPYTFLQSISQAEMYQKVSTRVYLAFPEEEIYSFKKHNGDDWNRITNLCKGKGIGMLMVERNSCKELVEPLELPQNIETYKDIINQFDEQTLREFDGFLEEDFDYFLGIAETRRKVVRRKIEYFLKNLRQILLEQCSEIPSIDPRKLQVDIGGFHDDACWCYVSQENKNILSKYAHFTIIINGDGVELVVNMETDSSVGRFITGVQKRRKDFLKILHDINEEIYKLKIWERVPPKGKEKVPHYMYDWRYICAFNVKDIDEKSLELIITKLNSLKHAVVRLVCPIYLRGNEIVYSRKLVDDIVNNIRKVQKFYSFVR